MGIGYNYVGSGYQEIEFNTADLPESQREIRAIVPVPVGHHVSWQGNLRELSRRVGSGAASSIFQLAPSGVEKMLIELL